jgi:hypothetical protein
LLSNSFQKTKEATGGANGVMHPTRNNLFAPMYLKEMAQEAPGHDSCAVHSLLQRPVAVKQVDLADVDRLRAALDHREDGRL